MSPKASNACWRRLSWCCALSWLLLAGCQTPSNPSRKIELVQRSRPLLGTFVTVSVYAADRAEGLAAISAAFAEFEHVDTVFSIHREDSELARLNREAARAPVTVSEELFDVIERVLLISGKSEGAFDPTIRPLADLWGFIWKEHRLPTEAELEETLPLVDYRAIKLNKSDRTIHFSLPGISIDSGGFGKGYAVDRAIERLREMNITSALVKAGGDLRAIGAPPGETAWPVQLEDPNKERNRVAIPLRDAALSTSGNYENFFEIDGKRYSHILDPRTGLPVQGVASCTVIAPTCLESDAWATAGFVLGVERMQIREDERYSFRFLTTAPVATDTSGEVRSSRFPSAIPVNRALGPAR